MNWPLTLPVTPKPGEGGWSPSRVFRTPKQPDARACQDRVIYGGIISLAIAVVCLSSIYSGNCSSRLTLRSNLTA